MNAKFAAAFLLLISIASAGPLEDRIEKELQLIVILTLTALLIIALAYMASQALMRREWEEWARNAGFQLAMSIAVLVGVQIIILTAAAISDELVGQDMFAASDSYLTNLAYERGMPLIYTLTEEALQNQMEAINFKFSSNPLTGGGGEATMAGEKTKSNAQDMLVNTLMPLVASLYAQQVILRTISQLAFPLILPIAFVLRIFPQTRTLADYAIAITVGFAVILPLTYVLNMTIADSIETSPTMPLIAPAPAADPDLHLEQITSLIPQAVFLPNLSLVITITFIMAFSKLLTRGLEPDVPADLFGGGYA